MLSTLALPAALVIVRLRRAHFHAASPGPGATSPPAAAQVTVTIWAKEGVPAAWHRAAAAVCGGTATPAQPPQLSSTSALGGGEDASRTTVSGTVTCGGAL